MAFSSLQERQRERVRAVIRAEVMKSLRRQALARIAASAAVSALILYMWPSRPGLYWIGGVWLFAALGLVQWRISASRHWARWQTYLFTALDAALITYLLLWPNPLLEIDAFPAQTYTRLPSVVYLFLYLALSALSYSWVQVAATGAIAAAAWGIGVALILARPDTVLRTDEALNTNASLMLFLNPRYVNVFGHLQEIVVLLVTAGVLALAVWRANAMMHRQAATERERAALARYFSPNLIDELAKRDRPLGAVRGQHAGVLFADMVGFTALSEKLGPIGAMALLRDFHERMAAMVFAHDGTVDKYIGDCIMATFGTPEPAGDDAVRALRCVAGMIDEIAAWNRLRRGDGAPEIAIGIGLHYGPIVAGNMGDERRLEYAVIGDTVNVAARIEHLTRERRAAALVSDAAMAAARAAAPEDGALARFRPDAPAELRGRAHPVALWAAA